MSNQTDNAAMLEAAQNLDPQLEKTPYIPLGIYLQEAEDLYHWCKDDESVLTNAGLAAEVITNLPVLTGACREAQSIWRKEQQTQKDAERMWTEESPHAFDFRDELIHSFRFAFRKSADLLSRIEQIADGGSNADLLQDLNDLAVLGRGNTEALELISFDVQKLEQAAEMSDHLADLLGQANGERKSDNDSKEIRDQMYSLLKQTVDEIRDCGKFIFWKDEKRLKGYSSAYQRRIRGRRSNTQNDIMSEIL